MRKFGLIGKRLDYSFSPKYFAEKFAKENIEDCAYQAYELDNIDGLKKILSDKELIGLNVTIPYKEAIFPFADLISEEVGTIGATNTIFKEDGKIVLYNTDVWGFSQSLVEFLGNKVKEIDRALVLGTGGASKAICYALRKLEVEPVLVSSSGKGDLGYGDLDSVISEHRLIVNTTPVGTFPDVDHAPKLPYEKIAENHFLFDLVYNPEKTLFLKRGEERGAAIKNGYDMLVLQAERSWDIWNNKLSK